MRLQRRDRDHHWRYAIGKAISVGSGREFLGAYRMVRLIRAGGTCQVWEAIRDEKRVAIKFLQPEVRIEQGRNRLPEARIRGGPAAAAPQRHRDLRVRHRSRLAFLVMEYHPGKNIKMLIRQGSRRLPT